MGAEPYWYFVPYQPDAHAALDQLRQQEFNAGRYNPVVPFLSFPIDANSPAPGAKHVSIRKAQHAAGEDGTRSILDIERVGDEPDFCVAAPLDDELLAALYGITQPTRAMIEGNMDFLENVDRGHCVYCTVYRNGKPDEILFAGYSFD